MDLSKNYKVDTLTELVTKLNNNADGMIQFVSNKVMEGKMLRDVAYLIEEIEVKGLSNELISRVKQDRLVDVIYVTDNTGVVTHCTDKNGVGLDLFKIDKSFDVFKSSQQQFVSTPVKVRVEDGQLFKFLAFYHKNCIYQVGLSLKSILEFE